MKKSASARTYSQRTLKILWGRAAGRCAMPECRLDLLVEATDYDPVVVIGDIAHIEASSDEGPRANRGLGVKNRDEHDNLILLCKNCHARLDGQKRTNTVAAIKKLRNDHEAWVRASLPERGRSRTGWNVLILQGEHPIDAGLLDAALAPDYVAGKPTIVSVQQGEPWQETFRDLTNSIRRYLGQRDAFDCRFAVFPLAPVSACLAAGHLLTNRPRVRLFQYHRTANSWTWPNAPVQIDAPRVEGLATRRMSRPGEVAICFHLSSRIARTDLPMPTRSLLGVIDIATPEPSVHWLKASAQLDALGATAGEVFEKLLHRYPNASRWHLFYAGPAPGAVKVGQQLNPTMTPPTQLYEFSRSTSPRYSPSILLNSPPT